MENKTSTLASFFLLLIAIGSSSTSLVSANTGDYLYPQFILITASGWQRYSAPLLSMRLNRPEKSFDDFGDSNDDLYVKEVSYIRTAFPPGALNRANTQQINMNNNGSRLYMCPEGQLITGINMRLNKNGDSFIKSFNCSELFETLHVNSLGVDRYFTLHRGDTTSSSLLFPGMTTSCGDNEFIVGLNYQDEGLNSPDHKYNSVDDHVTSIVCKSFEYI